MLRRERRSTSLIRRGSGMVGGGGVNDPADYPADGLLPGFIFPTSSHVSVVPAAIITRDCTPPNGIDDDGDGMVDEADETGGCTGVNAGDGGITSPPTSLHRQSSGQNWTPHGAANRRRWSLRHQVSDNGWNDVVLCSSRSVQRLRSGSVVALRRHESGKRMDPGQLAARRHGIFDVDRTIRTGSSPRSSMVITSTWF